MKNKWLWIVLLVLFIALAPQDAALIAHNVGTFVTNILGGFHLH